MKKFAISFKGGMALGLGSVGLVRFLQENELKPEVYAGSSSGALIAAAYCLGMQWDQILKLFGYINLVKLLSPYAFITQGSFISYTKFRKNLLKAVPKIDGILIEDLPAQFVAFATNRYTKERVLIIKGELVDALIASSAFPVLLPRAKGKLDEVVDGDLSASYSATALKALGVERVLGAGFAKGYSEPTSKTNPIAMIYDTYNILIRQVDQLNDKLDPPDFELEFKIAGFSSINFKNAESLVEQSYGLAVKNKAEIFRVLDL